MFYKTKIRNRIAIVWILLIILLILLQRFSIQSFRQKTLDEISDLQQNVVDHNWSLAQANEQNIEDMWKSHKILVQLNNLTPSVSRFEQKLSDIKVLVSNQDENALDYIGSLKNTFDSITSTFPTPEG